MYSRVGVIVFRATWSTCYSRDSSYVLTVVARDGVFRLETHHALLLTFRIGSDIAKARRSAAAATYDRSVFRNVSADAEMASTGSPSCHF